MKRHLSFVIIMLALMISVNSVLALDTGTLGGVPNPSEAVLRAMDDANYILHARDGKLTQVPAYKVKLDNDAKMHPQDISAIKDPSTGNIYVKTRLRIHKSTDDGLTWTSHKQGDNAPDIWSWQILGDGTFVGTAMGFYSGKDAKVVTSADEGRTWKEIGIIPKPKSFDSGSGSVAYSHWNATFQMYRLPGTDTLIWPIRLESEPWETTKDEITFIQYRSTDGGYNWTGPVLFTNENYNHPGPLPHSLSEGGIVRLPSGDLLAAIRYRRELVPTDPPGTDPLGYKNAFLIDSNDNGVTWHNLRPLTTAYGQTYGYPTALSDGTVIVIHDTRYGPGKPGARAMISYDEGQTWENEVYYLDVTNFHGAYTNSIALEDDTILTISATSDAGNNWEIIKDKVDIYAIRWKLVKEQVTLKHKISAQDLKKQKRARAKAKSRKRRIIVNDDSGELEHPGADTVEGFLEPKLKALAGTQVDTICWSILSEWGDCPSYDSKIQPIFGDAQDPPPTSGTGLFQKNLRTLIDKGLCPLQITIDFARESKMEILASVRMNDVHDGIIEPSIRTTWKKSHPELLVDTKGMLENKKLYITSQDYTHPEVRQRKLEIFEEVATRYDIDGFELDYFRQPVYFSETIRGLPVTKRQVKIMTNFMRQLRNITDAAAVRRDRPILLAASVPDNLQLALNIGLDLRTWLEEDLIDILIIGRGYSTASLSVEEIVKLARKYDVPIYPCINQKPRNCKVMTTDARLGCRGLASNWFNQGADGIYFWNLGVPFTWFPPKEGEQLREMTEVINAKLHEVGEPKTLAGKDKLYMVGNKPGWWYSHVSGPRPLPIILENGLFKILPIEVGDDLAAAKKACSLAKIELKLKLKNPVDKDSLWFRLNGKNLTGGVISDSEKNTITYQLKAEQVNRGTNFFEAAARGIPAQQIELTDIKLYVYYTDLN